MCRFDAQEAAQGPNALVPYPDYGFSEIARLKPTRAKGDAVTRQVEKGDFIIVQDGDSCYSAIVDGVSLTRKAIMVRRFDEGCTAYWLPMSCFLDWLT